MAVRTVTAPQQPGATGDPYGGRGTVSQVDRLADQVAELDATLNSELTKLEAVVGRLLTVLAARPLAASGLPLVVRDVETGTVRSVRAAG